jgi:hypothetical protein
MPGSLTTPGCPNTRVSVLGHVAFRYLYSVGTQDIPIAAQWLAHALPYRRFTADLAATDARLGDDAVRYFFIVSDFHRLLLASLPAHKDSNSRPSDSKDDFTAFLGIPQRSPKYPTT